MFGRCFGLLLLAMLAWLVPSTLPADPPEPPDDVAESPAATAPAASVATKPVSAKPRGKAKKAGPSAALTMIPKPAKGLNGKRGDGFTPEREAAALTFVGQHHTELVEVLSQLKEKHPREYRQAVQDLFRVSERLAQVRERDMGRYEHELATWKLKSRIQLLTVRLRLSPADESLKNELKAALGRELDLAQARLEEERQRLQQRLEKVETQLGKVERERQRLVDDRFERLMSPPPKDAQLKGAQLKGMTSKDAQAKAQQSQELFQIKAEE